ncbi:MAG: carbon-nitrogen hydrolase family protein [Thermoplasmatales archaeon]
MEGLKLLLNQINSSGNVEENKRVLLRTLDEDFDVAIFPELFYSSYLQRDGLNLRALDFEFVKQLQDRIGNRMIVFGAPVLDNFLYNSAIIVSNDDIKIYRKMHPPNFGPFEELRYFKRGHSPLTVNFKGFKIGIQICYDLFFQDTLEKGLDLVVNISASPFTSYPFFERVLPARAIENQSFVVYVNTVGLQRNLVFWGGSRVIDPDGVELQNLGKFSKKSTVVTLQKERIAMARRKRKVLEEVWDVD